MIEIQPRSGSNPCPIRGGNDSSLHVFGRLFDVNLLQHPVSYWAPGRLLPLGVLGLVQSDTWWLHPIQILQVHTTRQHPRT